MALQIRRGTEADRLQGGGIVFAEGELILVTDNDGYGSSGQSLYIGDSSGTAGGVLVASSATGDLSAFLTANTLDDVIELNKNLKLNGNDIVGTGNINITGNINATGHIVAGGDIDIGDAPGDTVTITAQVDSSITPETDTAYDLGTASKRWRNVYATGATIDGQIDAVALNADVVADNSTVMIDVSTNTFTGDLTGNVLGDLTGNVIGELTGDVLGNTTGYHTGDVKGSVFGNDSTPIVDAVGNTLNGNLTGNVTGNVTGNILSTNGTAVFNPGTDGTDASYIGDVQGNVTGNVLGDLTGNVTGNTTGYHTGDVKGSIFADGSTLLVDSVAGTIPGENITGTITAAFIGDVTGNVSGNVIGNVTGEVTGNIFTTLIDSADSSTITVTPALLAQSDLTVRNSLIVGEGLGAGPESTTTIIDGNGRVITDTVILRELQTGDPEVEIEVKSKVGFARSIFVAQQLMAGRELRVTNFSVENPDVHAFKVETYNGDPDDDVEFEDPAFYDTQMNVTATKAEFGVPVKFPSFTQTEVNALNNEVGMVVFNTTNAKLEVCTVAGTGGAQTYVALH